MQVMFQETELTNYEANNIFGNVFPIDGDSSLFALFRAITIDRNESKDLEFLSQKSAIYRGYINGQDDVEFIINNSSFPLMILEARKSFAEVTVKDSEWTSYNQAPYYIDRYLSQVLRTKVFSNSKTQRVIAIVDKKATHQWVQSFESMLWALLPWYYPSKSDDVIAFFKSLSIGKDANQEKAKSALLKFVETAAKKISMREMRLHKLLDGIADVARVNQIEEYKRSISDKQGQVRGYMSNLRELYRQLEECTVALSALENKSPESSTEVFDFFNQHKGISVINVSGTDIKYEVIDTLEFYDEDEANALFTNGSSWVQRDYTAEYRDCFKELFVNKRGIIKVSAVFIITAMKMVTPRRNEQYDTSSMPNPHIYFYACSGGNDQYYYQYADNGDWDLAIEQSISATKNWNVGDSAVGNKMLNWLVNCNHMKCIYMKDDCSPVDRIDDNMELVSFAEFRRAINKMKAEEKKESEENDG